MSSQARTRTDEDLLAQLAAAYPLEQREPSWSSLHQLSIAVAELRRTGSAPATVPPTRRARQGLRLRMPRRMSPLIIAGSVLGVFASGTGISYAAGVPIPAAVHSVARAVGLEKAPHPTTVPTVMPTSTSTTPTTVSPVVHATRQAESTLQQALIAGSPAAVISRDSSALAHRLARGEGHRTAGAGAATTDGQHLLHQACQQLEGSVPPSIGSTTSGVTPPVGGNGTAGPSGLTCTATGAIGHTPDPVPARSGTGGAPALPSTPTVTPTSTPVTGLPSTGHSGTGHSGSGPISSGPTRGPFSPSATVPGKSQRTAPTDPLRSPEDLVPATMNHIPGRTH